MRLKAERLGQDPIAAGAEWNERALSPGMQTSPEAQNAASAEVRAESGGAVTVILRGLLDAQSTGACWRNLEKQLRGRRVTSLDIDANEVTFTGGIGITLVSYLKSGGMTPGAKTNVHGLKKEMR